MLIRYEYISFILPYAIQQQLHEPLPACPTLSFNNTKCKRKVLVIWVSTNNNKKLTPVVEVTQNWSLECKIMFAGKPKISARFVEFGAQFLAACGGIRGPISRDNFFLPETYFWARFVTIL